MSRPRYFKIRDEIFRFDTRSELQAHLGDELKQAPAEYMAKAAWKLTDQSKAPVRLVGQGAMTIHHATREEFEQASPYHKKR